MGNCHPNICTKECTDKDEMINSKVLASSEIHNQNSQQQQYLAQLSSKSKQDDNDYKYIISECNIEIPLESN